MNTFRSCSILLLCLVSSVALAQEPAVSEEEVVDDTVMAADADAQPIARSLEGMYAMTSANIMKTAEMLDDEMYAYRPTEDVRSTGEMLAHIANAQYLFCSTAYGTENPNAMDFEESATTKDEIVAALKRAFAYCNDVYASMTDAQSAEMRTVFGNEMAVAGVLAFNTTHNYEHYGNLVTYMRMNGIVPPSSQQ